MGLEKADIESVAKSAVIARTPSDKADMKTYFRGWLQVLALAPLEQVNTGGVEPTTGGGVNGFVTHNVMREDTAQPSLTQAEVLANAPRTEGGYFKIPRIPED